ncbi:hypothetical protein MBCUT_18900 [Methanobrevibacter cuticularis]|uniref:Uncharacterized protein n=1 Tax=Methanobrevibacter cuticularis TaxID=47311 RepID=A0A166CSU3_9EURY|nr:hypothetical protein [Methanobrevibacter cuticularis]KZX14826.1 hypothetical protein MBCUT_18900 [Methanobrevibacter cuticularis]
MFVLIVAIFLAITLAGAINAASTKVTKDFPSSGETSFTFKVKLPKNFKIISSNGKAWKTYYNDAKVGGKPIISKGKSGSIHYVKFKWNGYVGKGVNMHMNVKFTYKDKKGVKHTITGGLHENKKKWVKGYES